MIEIPNQWDKAQITNIFLGYINHPMDNGNLYQQKKWTLGVRLLIT